LCNVIYWITVGFDGNGHIIDTHLTLKGEEGIKTQEKMGDGRNNNVKSPVHRALTTFSSKMIGVFFSGAHAVKT
jgi:hypothetical protein